MECQPAIMVSTFNSRIGYKILKYVFSKMENVNSL